MSKNRDAGAHDPDVLARALERIGRPDEAEFLREAQTAKACLVGGSSRQAQAARLSRCRDTATVALIILATKHEDCLDALFAEEIAMQHA
ncbi:MAG: hypothetical protein H6729_05675 [Deltaproteobacteria bacterium]|nr:hypothetical protein [Deltaproteobacteria bacterium]